MCIFVGLFVACFGVGNGRQSLLVTGIAIMVLAATTRVVIGFRGTPREWLQGVGRVLEVNEPPADARIGRCSLQLVVVVPGMPEETVVVHDSRVPVAQWPQPGQRVPIQVAADDIRDVRVQWRDFVPVEHPVEAAWHTDEPVPSPAVPPGSHLDPSPVIDFDLDHPPTGPIEPVAPVDRTTVDPIPTVEPATATSVAPAEASPADEGRLDRSNPLADDPADAVEPAAGDDGRADVAAPPDEVAHLAPAPAGGPEAVPAAVPRPRPSPRPSPRPRPHAPAPAAGAAAATAGAAMAGNAAGAATNGTTNGGTTGPPVSTAAPPPTGLGADILATYPSAHPGPAGAINGIGMTLLVSDLTRSVDFYRDRLGFYEVDNGAGTIVLGSGDTRLVLRAVANLGAIKHRLMHLNLEVSDIDAVYAELKANGVRFTSPPRAVEETARLQLWAAAFKDPDGHGVALTQWRPAG
ncbi:VOC family protein [Natronosporangium hydrolyticum]|uniref:VOC family protein n=1 Tax=Natronosporangium hydrolyticum TaxID=2811111 RepID=A0A895YE54_9ACTN|nr:VOC family protein [Natronosporangium hydrolyticum]QSB16067.1 VOC family protein [Natronosporangium hydrolyticum]